MRMGLRLMLYVFVVFRHEFGSRLAGCSVGGLLSMPKAFLYNGYVLIQNLHVLCPYIVSV
jgi:hypothetical protein